MYLICIFSRKSFQENHDKIYTKPYTRINPYLIGILLGYFLSRKVEIRSKFNIVSSYILSGLKVELSHSGKIIRGQWRELNEFFNFSWVFRFLTLNFVSSKRISSILFASYSRKISNGGFRGRQHIVVRRPKNNQNWDKFLLKSG